MGDANEVIIHDAAFCIALAPDAAPPETECPELALFGRSNVGKSTLINRALGRRALALVSKTPGKTRTVNYYRCIVSVSPRLVQKEIFLVDFPGFGYARYSKGLRQAFNRSTVEYLRGRTQLKGVLLLIDIKRALSQDEEAIMALAAARALPLYVVATKMDRFGSNERRRLLQGFRKAHGVAPIEAAKDTRFDALWQQISQNL
ncbi:MAG: ribosome biogenesis GTP-binding protein YihA/YsxC [Bdellovibrionota bacterium]|nr:MAG: ribosome biogenesis GTP-binding protein YihA/YsxC [Bdellovibrionota bacterium]